MSKIEDFKTPYSPTWCPGCGNYGIWAAFKNAFIKLGLTSQDILMVYGIGCHGHMVNYMKTYGFEGLHGRAIPVAVGAKIANHDMNVLAIAGDGDQLSEGGNHFVHACRSNYDICSIIHDNQIYGLTVGQSSPTSQKKSKSKSSPYGVVEEPINPLALSIISGATFVARSFSGDLEHLTEMIVEGIRHKGFSFIDIFQPCVVSNPLNTYSWYSERIYKLDGNHDVKDKEKALKRAMEGPDKLPLGIFYKINKPSFEEQIGLLEKKPLAEQPINKISVERLLKDFS